MSRCLLAAIADDYTGGSDLAGMLYQQGVPTAQVFGLPDTSLVQTMEGRYQAVVLSLKSRSIPAADACKQSLAAYEALLELEPRQVQFKYCSTFDSTPRGNIGPVTEALMRRSGVDRTVAVPALPVNGRTQYLGHLFVNGQLLSESSMRTHPLNPMTDSNLVRFLQMQLRETKAGLIPLDAVRASMHEALSKCADTIALVDAITDSDLHAIAASVRDLALITGGSGFGMALPALWRSQGEVAHSAAAVRRPAARGSGTVVLSGSCSSATLRQLELLRAFGCETIALDVPALMRDSTKAVESLSSDCEDALAASRRVCVYSSAPPGERHEGAASCVERAFGALAARLVNDCGVFRIVVAGGETSGAVMEALRVPAVEMTSILDPGVPALRSLGEPTLELALKSGNFGGQDFFVRAIQYMEAA